MRLKLGQQYLLLFLGLITVVGLSLALTFLWQSILSSRAITRVGTEILESELIKDIARRGEIMTGFLAENLANPIYTYDMEAIYELTSSVLQQKDVVYVFVYDDQGRIVHDGQETIPAFGQVFTDPVSLAATGAKQLITQLDGNTMDVAMPIYIGDTQLGGVRIGLSLDSINQQITSLTEQLQAVKDRNLRRDIIVFSAISMLLLILGTIFSFIVSKNLTRPIRRLTAYASQIGKGKYGLNIRLNRDDELGDLAKSFQNMSRSLSAYRE
ncbi:MAG: HAMP domain-containing protein, partial [Gammaproteobacteria bacterium]|nr:HAMP domain-containing protein [Gammaproteobacteria bacterium]